MKSTVEMRILLSYTFVVQRETLNQEFNPENFLVNPQSIRGNDQLVKQWSKSMTTFAEIEY